MTSLPKQPPLSEAEIKAHTEATVEFTEALGSWLSAYSFGHRVSPWTVLMGMETVMADVLASLEVKQRLAFFDILDLENRTKERTNRAALAAFVVTPENPDTSNGG